MANILESTAPRVNAIVSASAGTGKTWLLVTRLLRLLLAGKNPASILAVTFTQKAAAEIRERLTATLRRWTRIETTELHAELSSIDVPEEQFEQARKLYEGLIYAENDIRILTFHAFCVEILQRFPLAANVPPGFEICSEEYELREEALDRLYQEATDKNAPAALGDALRTLFRNCASLNNTNRALSAFLNHRNDWLAYTEGFSDPPHEASLHLQEMLGISSEDSESDVRPSEEACAAIQLHQRFMLRHPTSTFEKYAASIDRFLGSDKRVDNETWPSLWTCFFTQKGEPRKTGYESKTLMEKLGDEDFRRFRNNRQFVVENLAAQKDLALKHETLRRNRAWYTAGQRLLDIYQQLKLSRQQLDFDDLEWYTCHLINNENSAQWIQSSLNSRIDHVLVDEFQDTNPHQWQLLKPMLEEMAAQDKGGSAFIVGDIKQSIYGFRRADPSLQGQAQRWLQRHMQGRVYTSDLSRRAAPALIGFINSAFSHELPLSTDFRQHRAALDTPGGVMVLPFVTKETSDGEKPAWRRILKDRPAAKIDHPAYHEGRQIARQIRQMIDDRVLVCDRDHGHRSLRFGDVTLLLRRRTWLEHYELALREERIPYTGGQAEKMFGSLEIHDMLALLSFLIDNRRNLELAQILCSPIFSIDEDCLLALSGQRHWFAHLGKPSVDKSLRTAHELIGNWVEMARGYLPVHDLLSRIYHEGNVINRYRHAARDQEKELVARNLLAFLEYSLEFESGRYPSLGNFTQHLRRRMARAKAARPETPSISPSDTDTGDRVRILTIHQAKGLEAPLVILADCGTARRNLDTHGVLVDWPQDGSRPQHFLLVPRSADRDSFTQRCHTSLSVREKREDASLLYVAVTRARQYLLVSGSGSGREKSWYELIETHAEKSDFPLRTAHKALEEESIAETLHPETDHPTHGPLPPAYTIEHQHGMPNEPVARHSDHPGATDGAAKLRGTIIHCALQGLTENKNSDAVEATLAARFPEARQHFAECLQSAQALLAKDTLRELFDATRYEQVLNETPLSFVHDGRQYFGIADRICVGKDTAWVVDYKTHRFPDGRSEEIKALYAEQMHMYYLGASKLWPRHTVRVSLLLTETGQLHDYDFG